MPGMDQAPLSDGLAGTFNRVFAKRASAFADRAGRWPGMPILPALGIAGIIAGSVSGAFGTHGLPAGHRFAFWTALMALETAKWLALFGWLVREKRDYWRIAPFGTLALMPFIPAEVWLAYRFVGIAAPFAIGSVLLPAIALGCAILFVMAVVKPPFARNGKAAKGVLARHNIDPSEVIAAAAEDHYCRLYLPGGRETLVFGRFGDLLEDLAEAEGTQIHRGHWVSDAGVRSVRRAGRGWEAVLPCGTTLRISATYRAEARRRGWFDRRAIAVG